MEGGGGAGGRGASDVGSTWVQASDTVAVASVQPMPAGGGECPSSLSLARCLHACCQRRGGTAFSARHHLRQVHSTPGACYGDSTSQRAIPVPAPDQTPRGSPLRLHAL